MLRLRLSALLINLLSHATSYQNLTSFYLCQEDYVINFLESIQMFFRVSCEVFYYQT